MFFHMRKTFIAGLGVLALPFLVAAENVIPTTQERPVIDGKLNDACWENAFVAKDFALFKSPKEKYPDAEARIAVDAQWLYLALKIKNPKLDRVTVKNLDHDSSVHCDESMEIFFDPGSEGKLYFHFTLNLGNARAEQLVSGGGAIKDRGWFIPWRSAVRRDTPYWTAEIAIPLSALNSYGDPDKATINFLYNHIAVGLDAYGAVIGTDRKFYSWAELPSSGAHSPKAFKPVKGLPKKTVPVFSPSIESAAAENYDTRGGRAYAVSGTVKNYSAVPGEATIVAFDKPPAGETTETRQKLSLKAGAETPFRVKIPVKNFAARNVEIQLKNDGGEVLQTLPATDTAKLNPIKQPVLDRNYYTDEKTARLKLSLSFPEDALKTSRATVSDGGRILAESQGLAAENIFLFDIAAMPIGARPLTVAVRDDRGETLGNFDVTLSKKTPRPGHEVKIDQFKLILLKDNQSIFPFGPIAAITSANKDAFKAFGEAGFNAVMRMTPGWYKRCPGWNLDFAIADAPAFFKEAAANGLMVANWTLTNPPGMEKAATPEQERDFAEKFFREGREIYGAGVKTNMANANYLFEMNVDEPNLGKNVTMAIGDAIYREINAIDGYHPVFVNFACEFYDEAMALKQGDIFAFDPYFYPGWDMLRGDPVNMMAVSMTTLKTFNDAHGKVTYVVPIAGGFDALRVPRWITPEQQRAQTYAAFIHGAKGAFYFSLDNLCPIEMFHALGALAKECRTLAPALLNDIPKQSVQYDVTINPDKMIFPNVYAGLFRFPDGDYLLLAVNSKNAPVNATFAVKGAKGAAKRLFAEGEFALADGAFSDKLGPYATRAYRLSGGLAGPVEIAVKSELLPATAKVKPLMTEIQEIEKRKNVMPNPVFELRTSYPNMPDYVKPCAGAQNFRLGSVGSAWYLDAETPWRGHPSLKMSRNLTGPSYYGETTYDLTGTDCVFYPPTLDRPTPYVFSAWMKAAKKGATVLVTLPTTKTLTLDTKWKRYVVPTTLTPDNIWLPGKTFLLIPSPGATVWINGLQMERGTEATEFAER